MGGKLLVGVSAHLGCPLIMACMGCFGGIWSDDLARLSSPSKQEGMSGCLEVVSSCRGVGPLGMFTSVIASKPC